MTEDRTNLQWAKLAAAIRSAREARGLSQVALAELAGISEGTVQNLEDANRRPARMPQSLRKIAPHLGWAEESGSAILHGGDPIPAPATAEPAAGHPRLSDLPLRVVDELESDGPLLEAGVIQLPGANGARMTVVVRGKPDATPQEIQEALVAWRKAERNLHRLSDGDDGDDEPRAANGS
ncbi:helix-turn-helix transcriptional regulator [Streptomyces sp. NPDC005799]|uniref:helix-turn-helix domain-containing protein n=1 Tax=Streptomyces sp. NPDC005799 TaxID=3154678 RepID=UPI0033CC0F54